MFRNAYRLPFKLLGIPIHLDLTLLFILPILAWMIGSNLGAYVETLGLDIDAQPLQEGAWPFVLGLIAATGLFVSVLIHELGHAIVGRSLGVEIKAITLWLLGGMAQFDRMPRGRGQEAIMAIAGPVTSYGLAAICWLILGWTPVDLPAFKFVFAYLTWMNVILATFNLVPALPLDGGRILRSLLALRVDYLRATQIAAEVSKFQAFMFAVLGFLTGNLWLILIALFVYMAVTAETQATAAAELLRGIEVQDLMTEDVRTVSPQMSVSELLEKMIAEKHVAYPVVDLSGRIVGMVTLRDIEKRTRLEGGEPSIRLGDIMRTDFGRIDAAEPAFEAFRKIGENRTGRLVILDSQDRLEGILSKTDLVRAVRVRSAGSALEKER